jgi:hypothetical protein
VDNAHLSFVTVGIAHPTFCNFSIQIDLSGFAIISRTSNDFAAWPLG